MKGQSKEWSWLNGKITAQGEMTLLSARHIEEGPITVPVPVVSLEVVA